MLTGHLAPDDQLQATTYSRTGLQNGWDQLITPPQREKMVITFTSSSIILSYSVKNLASSFGC
jgi:hypothetical protein